MNIVKGRERRIFFNKNFFLKLQVKIFQVEFRRFEKNIHFFFSSVSAF